MTPDSRPDPETLLRHLQAEEAKEGLGRLKVFLGYSAGVGKTYAMLEAASVLRREGQDVCVGVVETHGRKETEALIRDLPILPRQEVEYKGIRLDEFDLDGALKRKPDILLVDELAHTNAPGSRHAKRWQDVEELLDRGISVYTTLNIQHLETSNDAVAQVTGISVHETVPDRLLERAEKVELVDLPPEELLKRLKDGKVYIPESASRALDHFFRIENLTALREISLRALADRVNVQAEAYRESKSPNVVWPTGERMLVCISSSPSSARLIRNTHHMASRLRAPWLAVFVDPPAWRQISEENRKSVSENLRLAETLGAETAVLSGEDFTQEVLSFARSKNVTRILIGKPPKRRWPLFPSVVDRLIRESKGLEILVTEGTEETQPIPPPKKPATQSDLKGGWFFALSVVIVCTLLAGAMFQHFALVNLIMVYLVGTVVVSLREGKGPSTFAAFLSVLIFDFFFVPPRLTLAIADTQYIFTFAIMLTVSLLLSELTRRLRVQAEWSRLREQRTLALFSLSQALAAAEGIEPLLQAASSRMAELFDADVFLFLPDARNRLELRAESVPFFSLSDKERGVAQWSYDLGRRAGKGTDTLPFAEALYIPLNGVKGAVGVARIRPHDEKSSYYQEQLNLLETFANVIALSVENESLRMQAQEAGIQAEGEKLRSALLSSVSHDIRTPLAAILGSATGLLESTNLNETNRKEMLENIRDEAERLNRLLSNLLEMTRISSGALHLKKSPQSLEEVVGSALARLGRRVGNRKVENRIPSDLPLVPMDPVLMEQLLFNLMDNTLKHTPVEAGLEVEARLEGHTVFVEIMDKGPGLTPGEEETIFEKFVRGSHASAPGSGLGLAVARGIAKAHDGDLKAFQRPGGGAVFQLQLPLSPPENTRDKNHG
jgi:two-component system sensor histidine kinase KdpD